MIESGNILIVGKNMRYLVDISELFAKLNEIGCHCENSADLLKYWHETKQLLDSGCLKVINWMQIEIKKPIPPDPKVGHFYERFINKRRRQWKR